MDLLGRVRGILGIGHRTKVGTFVGFDTGVFLGRLAKLDPGGRMLCMRI